MKLLRCPFYGKSPEMYKDEEYCAVSGTQKKKWFVLPKTKKCSTMKK